MKEESLNSIKISKILIKIRLMLHIFFKVHYDIGYQIENVIIYVFIVNLCLNLEFLQKCPLLKNCIWPFRLFFDLNLFYLTLGGRYRRTVVVKRFKISLYVRFTSRKGENLLKPRFRPPFWNRIKYGLPLSKKRSVFYWYIIRCIAWHGFVFQIMHFFVVIRFSMSFQNKKWGGTFPNPIFSRSVYVVSNCGKSFKFVRWNFLNF